MRGASVLFTAACVCALTLAPGLAPTAHAVASSETWRVGLVSIDGDRATQPAAGVTVTVALTKAASSADLVSQKELVTDALGYVSVTAPTKEQRLWLRFYERGHRVSAAVSADGAVIGQYQRAAPLDAVTMDVRANLETRDSGMRAWVQYTVDTRELGSTHWTSKSPLTIPVLAPRLGDVVLDRGLFPATARHVEVQAEGDVQVLRERDTLQLIGSVAPGRAIKLRVRYPIKAVEGRMELGFRGEVGRTYLAVAVLSVRPSRPRVVSVEPSRVGEQPQGAQGAVGLALLQPLGKGAVAHLAVLDLPAPAPTPRRALAMALALLIIVALSAVLKRS